MEEIQIFSLGDFDVPMCYIHQEVLFNFLKRSRESENQSMRRYSVSCLS